MIDITGKRILVVGMARSGIACAKLLSSRGAVVVVNDSKPMEELDNSINELSEYHVEYRLGCPAMDLIEPDLDMVVISPGIPDNVPFVKKARNMGIEVTGELEMAYRLSPGEMVAVTGTNGKTTTVTLLGEIFRHSGRNTYVVGNVGYPYSEPGRTSADSDLFVCEVSSFQMETASSFHPHVAVLTNITEDHLNRHGTMENYTAMKMRVFMNQTDDDVAVFNDDDPALKPLTKKVNSHVMLFSRQHEVKEGAFVRDGMIICRFKGTEHEICPAGDVYIPGPHNLENALAAVCIAVAMGVDKEDIAWALRTFKGVEHRIEFVRELDGVRYINDSKGTNVDSTLCAIKTMDRPTVIILGGYDKHCDFTPMAEEMVSSPAICSAVIIGATGDQIQNTLDKCGFTEYVRCSSLEEAVHECRRQAKDGWNVLFSPACASFDMFSDYESRGRIFKQIVNEL